MKIFGLEIKRYVKPVPPTPMHKMDNAEFADAFLASIETANVAWRNIRSRTNKIGLWIDWEDKEIYARGLTRGIGGDELDVRDIVRVLKESNK